MVFAIFISLGTGRAKCKKTMSTAPWCEFALKMQFAKLCLPQLPEAHFCKLAAKRNKNIYLQTKIKIFIAILGPSALCISPTTCAILASWTPSGKTKSCGAPQISCVVVPCTLFLEFCMGPYTPFFIFLLFFQNFASCLSGKHNSENRSYAKA